MTAPPRPAPAPAPARRPRPAPGKPTEAPEGPQGTEAAPVAPGPTEGNGEATEAKAKPTTVPPKIVKPKTIRNDHPLAPANMEDVARVLWFGDPGHGKTTAMCMLANVGKVVLLDSEQRLKRTALRRAGVNVDNIERHTDISYRALSDLFDELADRAEYDQTFVGILWDGLTELQRTLVANAVDAAVRKAERQGTVRDDFKTFMDDYGDTTEQFRRLLRKAMRIPVHIGVTCLSKRDKDENDAIRVTPQVTPAIGRDVNSAMDVITFLKVDEVDDRVVRTAMCQPLGRYDAKDTFGVLPRRLAEPTFPRILGYIREDLTPSSDEVQKETAQLLTQAAAKTTKGE